MGTPSFTQVICTAMEATVPRWVMLVHHWMCGDGSASLSSPKLRRIGTSPLLARNLLAAFQSRLSNEATVKRQDRIHRAFWLT
jgi:hypothetical protein